MKEPLETLTNLAFVGTGFAWYYFTDSVPMLIIGVVLSSLSYIYHRELDRGGQLADWFGMALMNVGITVELWSREIVYAWPIAAVFLSLYTCFIMGKFKVQYDVAITAVPLQLSLFWFFGWWALIPLGIFLIAYSIRQHTDHLNHGEVDSKNHAAWHIIMAVDYGLIIFTS